jgi:hypothetical protein
LFLYAVITALSFGTVSLLIGKQKRNWTIGSEMVKTLLILLLISILSYFYNSLFLSKVNLSFENYLYMFAYTSALGVPVCAIYIMARYIYLFKHNYHTVTTAEPKNGLIAEPENRMETYEEMANFLIAADYGNFCLEIESDDFVYAEAADNYCIIHFYEDSILKKEMIRISLTKLSLQIQSKCIKKVHRSFVVNLKKVSKYEGNSSGYKISLDSIGKEISVSRNYIDSIIPVLKNLVTHP